MTSTTPASAQALSRGGDSRIRRSVPSRASRRISQTRTDSPYRWRAAGLEGIRVVLSIPARLTAILAINDDKRVRPELVGSRNHQCYSYAHSGISLQECLTPVLVVSGGSSSAPAAAITEISWKGLRCIVEVSGATAGMQADLRRDAGARLLVEDDELEGVRVVAVLLSPEGGVIAQRRTRVSGNQ